MRVAGAIVFALALSACRQTPAAGPQTTTQAAPVVANSPPGTMPHGDHNPHHGGIVLMKGELHYEVVFDKTGREHRVYFTDAVREELPASVASAVTLTIKRPKAPEETIDLKIDEAGESWIGSGRPVDDPKATTARVAFTINHEPYFIDVPFALP